jgi:hypothetical protein
MMFSKKIAAGLSLLILLATTSCSQFSSLLGSESRIERNLFTGLPGKNGPILAVKFDDTTFAHPQQGIESADIVFVTQVEAGLTRLMAIYSSTYPEQVGPVRSARISDIDILAQFGKVGFAYSGAQKKMRPILASANLVNLSAERNSSKIYPTDPNRTAPYAMMLHPNMLLAKAGELSTPSDIGIDHGAMSDSTTAISGAVIHWPNAKYEVRWSEEEQRFLTWHDGKENLNTEGVQLGSPMMVIQLCDIHPSEFGDKFGGITPKTTVTGTGRAYFLRNGTMTKVKWSRPDATSPTIWTLENGDPAHFERGQIWFFLTNREPDFISVDSGK